MSDARVRELERRFERTGSPGDEAAWLGALLQVGDLPRERVELAALLGHEAAARCTSLAPLPEALTSAVLVEPPDDRPHPASALRIAGEDGRSELVGVTHVDLPTRDPAPGGGPTPWDALLLERPLAREAVRRLAVAVAGVAYATYCDGRSFGVNEWVTEEVWALERALVEGRDRYRLEGEGADSAAFEARGTPSQVPAQAVASVAEVYRSGDRGELLLAAARAALGCGLRFRERLAIDLVPWLLGRADPLALRVAARGPET